VPLDIEPMFLVRNGGDRIPHIHASGADWRDDFAEHTDKIRTERN
jgi:hypothetical protein